MSRFNRGILMPETQRNVFSIEDELIQFGEETLVDVDDAVEAFSDPCAASDECVASQEGIGTDIRNGFDDLFQFYVVNWKHWRDVQNDFWSATNPKIARYEQKLKETEREFNEKRHSFREGNHHISLMELWYFFRTKEGETRNILRDMKNDTAFSHFVLVEYNKLINDQLKKAASILQGAHVRSVADAQKLFSQIEGLKSIDEMFDDKWLGDGRYFNVTSVVKSIGSVSKTISSTIGGKDFTRLAELAAASSVSETKSKKHTLMKVAANVTSIGAAIKGASIAPMELSTDEIAEVIQYGKVYIANLDQGLELNQASDASVASLIRAFENLKRNVRNDIEDSEDIKRGMRLVGKVIDNYITALKQPFGSEVIRSIKGAKYSYYIGLRAIYNASKYI